MRTLRSFLGGVLLLGSLTACDPAAADSAPQPVGEVAQVVAQTPEDVLRGFMEAWNAGDLQAMYGYVSQPSRQIYPFEIFERRYTTAQDKMGFTGVTYTVDDVTRQGTTAIITYDARLQSPLFNEIEDPDRLMRLIQVEGGWQIAWTPMDILTGLASEVSLDVLTRFPPRGHIYDRNGDYVVEEGGTIVSVSIIKNETSDVEACITLLASVLKRERDDLAVLFSNYNPESLFHVGEIDTATYTRWRADLEAICGTANQSSGFAKIDSYTGRSYAGHGSAAHITGYIGRIPGDRAAEFQAQGYGPGDIVGVTGIEAAYQPELAGRPERYLRLIESGGATIRELGGVEGASGQSLQLTIDMRLQNIVAQALSDAFNYAGINWATRAGGGAVVVMRVDTGEILALASYPFFDPSLFNPESSYTDAAGMINALVNDPRQPLANKAVQEQYTPGSVYKIFTTVAAANQNIFTEGNIFDCELTWSGVQYGDQVESRQDWRVVDEMPAAGPITMSEALTTSCNPFFWQMGALLYDNSATLHSDYLRDFGFGSVTGLRILGNEAAGSIADPRNATEAINNAIGQGSVQTTAVQMAAAVTAIANRGTLYRPYIIQQVGGFAGDAVRESYEPIVIRQLDSIRPDVFDTVFRGMCDVPVNEDLGTSWLIFNGSDVRPDYTSCGKTGTAETGAADSGRPPNAWYAAFAPAENPEIVVVAVVPTSREGSQVTAPIVRRILDGYFNATEAPFPDWWAEEYEPLKPPVGVG